MRRCWTVLSVTLWCAAPVSAQVLLTIGPIAPSEDGQFGVTLAPLGDINGDAHDDLIVGAPFEGGSDGHAYLFSGAEGAYIRGYGGSSPDMLGHGVSGIGDLNGNGYPDVIIGAPGRHVTEPWNGMVWAVDGFTGGTIWWRSCPPHPTPDVGAEMFGNAVAEIGDVNGDGISDIIAGAWGIATFSDQSMAGHAYILDGTNGADLEFLFSSHWQGEGYFSCSVASAGDVNGDGQPDVVVGARGEGGHGYAYTYEGYANDYGGVMICCLESPNPEAGGRFGNSVAGLGDVDGDGVPEVVVGAPEEDQVLVNAGRAYVMNGLTGAVVHALQSPSGPSVLGNFGHAVAGYVDVTGDGVREILVGAPGDSVAGHPRAGRAYVFDGASGDPIWTLSSPSPANNGEFGAAVAEAGDLNGDGWVDILVGAPRENFNGITDSGRVYAFSGAVFGSVMSLDAAAETGHVVLSWSPLAWASQYWVYGAADLPWFQPGMAPGFEHRVAVVPSGTTTWSTANGVGDPTQDWTYMVIAVGAAEDEVGSSNRAGEEDFEIDIP